MEVLMALTDAPRRCPARPENEGRRSGVSLESGRDSNLLVVVLLVLPTTLLTPTGLGSFV
jgi:hypothetical protein